MPLTHATLNFNSGDTWEIVATLQDGAGAPLDLTGATIAWTMTDTKGNVVIAAPSSITPNSPSTAGIALIVVLPAVTQLIGSGYYFDKTVVTLPSGEVATESVGEIQVI
jgi:hypothetical protein